MRLPAFLLATVAVLAASPFTAHADTFSYDYSFPDQTTAFTYTSPVLISTDTTFTPTTCVVVGTSCTSVEIDPPDSSILVTGSLFSTAVSGLPASFFSVGTHTFESQTMTITDNSTPSIPEPSTFTLLGTGLLGLMEIARRKYIGA